MAEAIVIKTPLGNVRVTASDKGITSLGFTGEVASYDRAFPFQVRHQLEEYFSGALTSFTVPLDLSGTEFELSVWEALLKIPYGEVISYKQLAQNIGRPRAVRAVGRANGKNPVPIIVPCHRVVGVSGLGGYSLGLDKKEFLLELEEAKYKKK